MSNMPHMSRQELTGMSAYAAKAWRPPLCNSNRKYQQMFEKLYCCAHLKQVSEVLHINEVCIFGQSVQRRH